MGQKDVWMVSASMLKDMSGLEYQHLKEMDISGNNICNIEYLAFLNAPGLEVL